MFSRPFSIFRMPHSLAVLIIMPVSKEILLKVLKWLLHITCLILFVAYTITVFELYFEEQTATLVDFDNKEKHQFPTLTICPEKPYKENRLAFTNKDLLELSYDLSELVHYNTSEVCKNPAHI